MLKPVFLVAFSGNRPDGTPGRTGDALENTAPHLKRVLESLRAQAQNAGGVLHLVSGVAEGADIVACETARSLGIPLHIVLPKPEDEFLSGLIPEWKPRALALLSATRLAAEPQEQTFGHPLPPYDPRNTCRVGGVSRHSPDCYAEANSHMLEVADLLLMVSTSAPSKSIAGTVPLARQAKALKLPYIRIDPSVPTFEEAYHARWLRKFAQKDCPSLHVFRELGPYIRLAGANPSFSAIVECLRVVAGKSSTAFRRSTATAILLHAIAGFFAAGVAALYYALKTDPNDPHHTTAYWLFAIVALTELLLVGIAFFLEWLSGWRNEQHIWLNCRFARELMRGIEAANPFLDPLFPEVRRHHPQWERFATTSALLIRSETGTLDSSSADAIKAARSAYLKNRIHHQINHFAGEAAKASPRNRLIKGIAHLSAPAALAVVAIAFLAKADDLFFHGSHKPAFLVGTLGTGIFLLFLPIFFPLLASLSSSFLAAFDFGRRSVRYREMEKSLQTAALWLPTLQALSSIQATVRRTEEILLDEQIEWFAAQKSGFGH